MDIDTFLSSSFSIPVPSDEEIEKRAEARFQDAKYNPNQFSNWFHVIEKLKIKTPKTICIPLSRQVQDLVLKEDFEAVQGNKEFLELAEQVRSCFKELNTDKLFIKTSLFSSKHGWKNTCAINLDSDILNHIANIFYDWFMHSADYALELIVREFIPTKAAFFAFNDMPVTEEYRFFSVDGSTYAYQPYWVASSIRDPDAEDWESKLKAISNPNQETLDLLSELASQVTKELTGDWSVDFLRDENGEFWLIDMAITSQSYQSPDMRPLTAQGIDFMSGKAIESIIKANRAGVVPEEE